MIKVDVAKLAISEFCAKFWSKIGATISKSHVSMPPYRPYNSQETAATGREGNYDGKKNPSFSFPFLHLYTNFASEL